MPFTLAQSRIAELAYWFARNSVSKRTPLGGRTSVGNWAMIVGVDPEAAPELEFEDGAFPVVVSNEVVEGLNLPPFDASAPDSQASLFDRIWQLVWKVEGGQLPPAAIIALDGPTDTLAAAIDRAGASGVDMAAYPVLAVPAYRLSPADRLALSGKVPLLPA